MGKIIMIAEYVVRKEEADTIRFAARLNPSPEAPYCKSVNIRIYAAVKTAGVGKTINGVNDIIKENRERLCRR